MMRSTQDDIDGPVRLIGVGIVVEPGPDGVRLLITRRLSGDAVVLGGFWEFPGGKVERGETVERAIERELREEVGLDVRTVRPLTPIDHTYPHGAIRLHAMVCRRIGGQPVPLQVAELRWVSPAELAGYDFPPANRPLLAEVTELLTSPRGLDWAELSEDQVAKASPCANHLDRSRQR